MSFWTDEKIADLKKFWLNEDMSCAQIGALLGCTRNAVIGKINRVGLSNARPDRVRARVSRTSTSKARSERQRRREQTRQAKPVSRAQQYFIAEPLPQADVTDIARVSFQDLDEALHCRWPCGEFVSPSAPYYCGHDRVAGLSYCVDHVRRAYRPELPHQHLRSRLPADARTTSSLTPADAEPV